MNVQFLAALIKSNQRVVVPGLGAFLHKENGVVVFSPFLNKDDGMLLGAICRHYGLSISSAQVELDVLVDEIRLAMTQIGKFYIDGVGILILNENGGMSLVEEGIVNNGIGGGNTPEGRIEGKVGVENAQEVIPSIDPLLSRANSLRGVIGQSQKAIAQAAEPVAQSSYQGAQSSQPSQQFSQAGQSQAAAPVAQSSYGQMPQRVVSEQNPRPQPAQSTMQQSVNQPLSTMPRAVGGVQSSGYSAPVSQIGRPVQPSWVPPVQPSNKGVPQVQPRAPQLSTQDQSRAQQSQEQANNSQRPYGTPQQTRPQVAPQRSPMAGSQPSQQFAQGTQPQSTSPVGQPRPQTPQTAQNQPSKPTQGGQPQGQQNTPHNRTPNGRPAQRPTQGKPNRAPQKTRQPQKGAQNKVDMWLLVAIIAAILVVILIIYGLIYTDPINQIF